MTIRSAPASTAARCSAVSAPRNTSVICRLVGTIRPPLSAGSAAILSARSARVTSSGHRAKNSRRRSGPVMVQEVQHTLQGRRHRLPAHRFAITVETRAADTARLLYAAPRQPYRTPRLVRAAAARAGDAGDGECPLRAAVGQRARHLFTYCRVAARAVRRE